MFNLFKKSAQLAAQLSAPSVIINEQPQGGRDYPEVVTQIHKEFHEAGDRILDQANLVLNGSDRSQIEKGKLLTELGFVNTKQAKDAETKIGEEKQAKEDAKLVTYYGQKYPCNKFITEVAVGKICSKYNLVCGDVSLFSGFVPADKLNQIKNFKVDNGDLKFRTWSIGKYNKRYPEYFNQEHDDGGSNAKAYTSLFGKEERSEKLKICAPYSDMKTSGYHQSGYKMEKDAAPDPVVLQPVKGGYLIVAAWGDEASDELVMNPKHN